MKYERFEELPVWQAAADLSVRIFSWTTHAWFRRKGDLSNQLQRASLSVSNNIAEGFERGSTNELLQFLYISRGSAGEVRSMLCVIERMDAPNDLKSQISDLKSCGESISRQICGWANSLQNSEITGQRHLNDTTRQAYEQRRRHNEFQDRIRTLAEESHRQREQQRMKSSGQSQSDDASS